MPPRRPRRAPPTSRLTRTARVALGVILVGVVVLRSGWSLFSRGAHPPRVPLAQEGPAPGRQPTEGRSTPDFAATIAAASTSSLAPAATALPAPLADAADSSPADPDASARLVATARLDGRLARGWLVRDLTLGIDVPTVTIHAPGQATRSIAWSRLDPRAGSDVTGDGRADLVIERDTGGMGCCWSLWVYEVDAPPSDSASDGSSSAGSSSAGTSSDPTSPGGATSDGSGALGDAFTAAPVDGLTAADAAALGLRPALRLPLSRCRGTLEDMDGDGSLEVVTCDSSVPVALCPALEGADPEVVLRYTQGRGYVPVTPRLRSTAAGSAVDASVPGSGERSGELCTALPSVLGSFYSGRDAQAEAELASVRGAASAGVRIHALLQASPLYGAPGSPSDGAGAAVIVMDETR
ncbi:MAG: hypothetical protein ABI780_01155 [Ardenticatenales bacterium]